MANWNLGNDEDFSFEDSERFEEDSQASYDESNDGINQNWRGWSACPSNGEAIQPGLSCVVHQYQYPPSGRFSSASTNTVVQNTSRTSGCMSGVLSLAEISARMCAEKWSFQQLEDMYQYIVERRAMKMGVLPPSTTIPEKIFLSFIVHCFPQSTDEIRMYSTLANGTCEQFNFGNSLYQIGSVRDVSQTGFLLSANVSSGSDLSNSGLQSRQAPSQREHQDSYHVTVKVDRCRIVECTCECSSRSSWCQHVVALSLYRIHQRHNIKFNETIADAINSMSDFELRKLVQWHINEIPRKCIPGFQRLIDQIKDPHSEINKINGAPDPTDGGHEAVSKFDFPEIEDKIRRLLCKYCVPSPSVHCDVQYLSATQHPTTVEWNSLIKPLRAREPEGMWNLLQMVREMFARNDENSVALLRTITDECLSNTQVLLWWYITKLVQSGEWCQQINGKMPPVTQMLAQYNCAFMCDEVVNLWKCVAINPRASKDYRLQLATYLQDYHRTAVNRLKTVISGIPTGDDGGPIADTATISNHQTVLILQSVMNNDNGMQLSSVNMRFTLDMFPGFHSALQMCNFLCEKSINFGVPTDAFFDVAEPNLSKTVKMVAPSQSSKKNRKKRKRKSRRPGGGRGLGRPGRQGLGDYGDVVRYEELNGVWRVVLDEDEIYRQHVPAGRAGRINYDAYDEIRRIEEEHRQRLANQLDSTESGQESDVQQQHQQQQQQQPSTSRMSEQQQEQEARRKEDSIEMDVNEVLAAAFTPLDAIESRFLKCEAFATHGYRVDAVDQAGRLIDYLLDNLEEQAEMMMLCMMTPKSGGSAAGCSTSTNNSKEESQDTTSCSTEESSERGGMQLEGEVAKSNKLLATMEKILYVSKVLRASSYLHSKVFTMTLKALAVTKWPLATKHQQIMLFYIEAEYVAILQQLMITSNIGSIELEHVKSVAQNLVSTNAGNNGDLPPIALAQFLFEALHSPTGTDELQPGNASTSRRSLTPQARIYNDELALQTALNQLGSSPTFNDAQFPMHCEAIRRLKNEMAQMLLMRFKESHEKLGLIMDKILDPTLHRMYTNHASNAAYFLARCPIYLKHHKNQQRPVYPYRSEEEVLAEQLEQVELAGTISGERRSDEGMQSSSSSSELSMDMVGLAMSTHGLTNHNAATLIQQQQNQQKQKQMSLKDTIMMKKKMKRRHQQNAACLATEAHVYHMHELAKKVLAEAGGQHNNVFALGNAAIMGSTHRKLHLCAVIIAVYAMGMNNRISPSWNTRTYSTSASWIAGQVQDIGPSAVEMIRETWTSHFTPSEIATISDRAGPSSDPQMRREAARLALSVLPYAHSLNDEEIISALEKCRNDGREMLIQALTAMDTHQFRQISRTKPLFIAMQNWFELGLEEGAQQQQQMQQQYLVANPYVHMYPPPPPVQNPYYQVYPQEQQQEEAPPPAEGVAPIHQSQSAPQLGVHEQQVPAVPAPVLPPAQEEEEPAQQANSSLQKAFKCGIRALDCMASTTAEDRQMFLKFSRTPPYYDEVMKLYHVATQMDIHHILIFFNTAARSIVSPYVLHKFATDSIKYFPYQAPFQQQQAAMMFQHHGYFHPQQLQQLQQQQQQMYQQYQQQQQQQQQMPMPLMQHTLQPMYARYPNAKFASPGMISTIFVQSGFHMVTGELFERACEQYLQAIINKLNSPRLSDTNEICQFISNAYEAFKCIPAPIGRNLFDDFVRTFKKQKAFRKEIANAINTLLNNLC